MNYIDRTAPDTYEELPEGLALAFAQDVDALVRFTNLTTEAQNDIIRRAKNVKTKNEMRRLVTSIDNAPATLG